MHGQERALAVHRHVASTPLDLLAAVQAALFTFCRRFDRLAVQDRVARQAARPTQRDLAPPATKHRHRLRPDAPRLPAPPVVIDCVPRWEVVRQRPPAATFAQAVKYRLNHAPLGVLGTRAAWVGPLEEARELLPLLLAQVTGIAHAINLPARRQSANASTRQLLNAIWRST